MLCCLDLGAVFILSEILMRMLWMHPGLQWQFENDYSTPEHHTTITLVSLLQVYDLNTVAKDIELPGAFFLGAGAVSSRAVGVNAEVSSYKCDRYQWFNLSTKIVKWYHAQWLPLRTSGSHSKHVSCQKSINHIVQRLYTNIKVHKVQTSYRVSCVHYTDWYCYRFVTCSLSQFIPIALTKNGKQPAVNGSYLARINPADKRCLLEKYNSKYSDYEFGLMGNLYASEGQPGKVRIWIRGDFSCRTLWLKGNSSFSIKSHLCDNSKRAIPWSKYPDVRNHGWWMSRIVGYREQYKMLRNK